MGSFETLLLWSSFEHSDDTRKLIDRHVLYVRFLQDQNWKNVYNFSCDDRSDVGDFFLPYISVTDMHVHFLENFWRILASYIQEERSLASTEQ